MSLEENKAIIHSLIEAVNKQDLALLDDLMVPYYVDHALQQRGLEDFKQLLTKFYKSFPDWHETIEDIIAEGDKVWVRVKYTATNTGEYRGYLPLVPRRKYIVATTGKKITFTSVLIWRIVDGKVVEKWAVYDVLDFYKQLGVIEYKGFPEDVT